MSNTVEIETFDNTLVVSGWPAEIDAYMFLDKCANIEREGPDTYRFEGVENVPYLRGYLRGLCNATKKGESFS